MHLKKGYKLHNGKYQLLNIIGKGGFSLTYKGSWKTVVQGSLGKIPALVPVCIKEYFFKDYCLRDESTSSVITNSVNGKEIFEKYKERLIKEAKILSEVHHPNIVNVLEVFKENNTVYIVMEFISGQSLKQKLEESGIFTEAELMKIIFKIGQALQFIHDKNILHLDIKPSNILINNKQNPILIDFGISKRYDLSDLQETSTTILAASKGYASIEQYDSEGMQSFSPCPDIYSLGATMYYLLTGQVPMESILRSTKGLESPRALNPNLSSKIEKVILKAMELNPSDRYQSVMEMMLDMGFNEENDKTIITKSTENDEDKTEILRDAPIQDFSSNNEDETILNNSDSFKKTNKKKIWILAIGAILIIGACFTYIYGIIGKPDSSVSQNELLYDKHFHSGIAQFYKQNFSQAKEEFYKALEFKEDGQARYYIAKIDSLNLLIQLPEINIPSSISSKDNQSIVSVTPSIVPENVEKNPKVNELSPDEKLTNSHNELFNNALTFYNDKKFKSAKEYFQKANKIKETSETLKYIELCNNELKKEEIDKKKELYEIKMDFGNFVVVRKKTNNLYGAIDKNGNEIIICKYQSLEPAGENKAFQRGDGSLLYDIYSPDGKLIHGGEGVSSY